MKKYTKMVLAGVLLSSAVLGANTSVVKAASNDPLNVDKSAIANNVIQVINELLNSKTTANKVNPQTNFSDLEDGSKLSATPIFGKKSSSEFSSTLQSELNIVDDKGQLVPMTVTKSDAHGFATDVSYTLNGTTKKATVSYNLTKPTVSFSKGTTMNFKSTDEAEANLSNLVTAKTTNGDDANGKQNPNPATLSYTPSPITTGGLVSFKPSDIYGPGISAKGTVNIYSAPTTATIPTRNAVTETAATTVPYVFTSGTQRFLATPVKDASVSGTSTVNYDITAIDSAGNPIIDSESGSTIEYPGVPINVKVNSESGYTIVFQDKATQKTVYTADVAGTDTSVKSEDAQTKLADDPNNKGYSVVAGQDTKDITAGEVEFDVTRDAATTINYIDVDSGNPVGNPEDLPGNNGSKQILTKIPSGYQLVNLGDFMQTLNADQTSKDVYVKKISNTVGNLSYTVTYRNKSNGDVVGTPVKSEGALGDYIGLTAPDGYAFASVLDNGFLLLKNNQNVTKYVVAADTPYSISYVDQDTGKEVGTDTGKGADGSKIVLKAPTDYAFVNADDVNYTIDKDTPTSTVYVQKSDQTEDNIVSGYPKNGYIKIYDEKGKLNNDVVLSEGSSWIIDKSLTINGAEYYRVATNEYVKASDVYKYTPLQTVATTNGKNLTPVYNSRGQVIIDRALDTNTPWYTDRSATIRGQKMYPVATDEWIKASDSTLR
ncbi:SLAP domain-containing protein [Companilactobacillus muriivasis]|uniref:SLAP domain-containing protein n=1 Tax=Companilactobacillus muriivasis TaxID=3081444 RepID=UPI0030C68C8F